MKRILILTASFFALLNVKAQKALTMDEIRDAIEKNHPALKMLDAEARSMDEEAKGAYSWMAPELGAGFYQTPYDPGRWKRMDGNPGMGMFMISAQQMFPNKKSQDAESAYMQAQSSVEKQKKDVVLNELLYTARKNYYDWIVLEKRLNVLEENEKLLNFMIQSAEIRYKNGLGKISAYYKAKAALANTENTRLMLQNEITLKQIAINTLMNRNADEVIVIDTDFVWMDFSKTMFDSSALMKNRSDIKMIGRSIEVNNLQRESELAKLKPTFGIRYDHMMGWARQPVMFSVMGMVRIPLARWSSKMNKAKAESLIWKNEALKNQQQMILNESAGMANAAYADLESKKKQMRLYEEQIVPALRKNFQTMELGYEQNTEDLFELFDAWDALNMTRMEYLDQLQKALEMQADLMRIIEKK
ncbi:MAG: TolC family protein [Chitinophagaceae bacterium]|jgi:outer membrane protein TolC|nr:TolC family protein [Chitinophagaceae bacterium]OQY95021.1 MAG: transporter [Sphingobacteriales bacterium UTBCD1]